MSHKISGVGWVRHLQKGVGVRLLKIIWIITDIKVGVAIADSVAIKSPLGGEKWPKESIPLTEANWAQKGTF